MRANISNLERKKQAKKHPFSTFLPFREESTLFRGSKTFPTPIAGVGLHQENFDTTALLRRLQALV